MALSAKTVKKQLLHLKPLMGSFSLKTLRKNQNRIGELMESRYREQVVLNKHPFERFEGAWISPKDERRSGVILYLHGGGYICGNTEYAAGFGSMLSALCGVRVFCAAYRLAPEHPFPCALEDALEAYEYLQKKGYTPSSITLCGESSGGGLCYALCLKLKEQGKPLPCGIVAISPWSDLTASGESYKINKDVDPTMTVERLSFFADSYTTDRQNPLVSPLFGELEGLPPSLIFAGSDEIMLDDARLLHEKLLASGCKSRLAVGKERWHVYLLYGLKEDEKDFLLIDGFLNGVMSKEKKLRWLPLDNAAKLYPAARTQEWSNVFRVSATLREEIDVEVMQKALEVTVRRFPSIAVKLCKGVFWYYLQELSEAPRIMGEHSYPMIKMSKEETRKCALRVIVYHKRVAVEIFHSITDGNGGLVFLKSLVAEYLTEKYGLYIPAEKGVLGRLEYPSAEEMEDCFQKNAGPITASRKASNAFRLSGTPEKRDFLHVTCFKIPVDAVLKVAHEKSVSLTAFLCACLMMALQNIQKDKVPNVRARKPIKVLIPVNLRKIFPSKTLRNFVLFTVPEILPRLGEYSFEEICGVIKSRISTDVTPKQMSMKIATNVKSEQMLIARIMPLFLKNAVMKAVYRSAGEKKSCLSISNLGNVSLPEAMIPYVERFDFIIGMQETSPCNCSVLSYNGTLYINFIRNIKESDLEYRFFKVLQEFSLPVEVESNGENEQ